MRPSIIFLGLFTILMLMYFSFSTFMQTSRIFILQLLLTLALLAFARWRQNKKH